MAYESFRYSGITKEKLEPVTTTLSDIQSRILDILTPRTILVGHSLHADLAALKLTHPYIVDTTLAYPHPRGLPLRSSLRWLTKKYLGREIQQSHGSTGHDSIEDARATLDLIKQKCEKGPRWGTTEASSEPIFKRLTRVWDATAEAEARNTAATIAAMDAEMATEEEEQASLPEKKRLINGTSELGPKASVRGRCAIVDWGDPRRGFGAQADVIIGCKSDDEVVDGVKSVLSAGQDRYEQKIATTTTEDLIENGNDINETKNKNSQNLAIGGPDPSPSSSPNVMFVWARLRELEAFRGWWNRNRNNGSSNGLAKRDRSSPTPPPSHRSASDNNNNNNSNISVPPASLAKATSNTVSRIAAIHASLPPRTAFIVYTGSGDPRETARLQAQQQTFRREYSSLKKKWDELSVQWTDVEENQLREACARARMGIGFVGVVT